MRKETGALVTERNQDIMALSETKMKDKGVEWFRNIQGIKSRDAERTRSNRRGGNK